MPESLVKPITLSALFRAAGIPHPVSSDPRITGLTYDSRSVKKGDLFFAMSGTAFDGHHFVDRAVAAGAVAAVGEKNITASVPYVQVSSIMEAMSKLAHIFYGKPTENIPVIGVTGTNGKTTVTYLVEDIFQSAGKTCGVLGTINYRFGKESTPAPNTTPFPIDIHRFAHDMIQKKADAVVMEVSSHALELGRVADVHFEYGVFMNLTQDHLDFHTDMEHYFNAKAKLFRRDETMKAVINRDDPYGVKLIEERKDCVLFGFSEDATIKASEPYFDLKGLRFHLHFPSGKMFPVTSNLIGEHNISNLLAAAAVMSTFGFDEKTIVQGLHYPHRVPGRFERIDSQKGFLVLVDYAHTPDALEKALATLKKLQPRRLICVFGAGGDRDKKKRPLMGKIAATMADHVIITSDNPRTEDPTAILKDIEQGIKELQKTNYEVQEKRDQAIGHAIALAKASDIVLIAGKGHEDYQIYGREKIPFSDQMVARRALKS